MAGDLGIRFILPTNSGDQPLQGARVEQFYADGGRCDRQASNSAGDALFYCTAGYQFSFRILLSRDIRLSETPLVYAYQRNEDGTCQYNHFTPEQLRFWYVTPLTWIGEITRYSHLTPMVPFGQGPKQIQVLGPDLFPFPGFEAIFFDTLNVPRAFVVLDSDSYASVGLPAGSYRVHIQKPLFDYQDITVMVP